MIIRCRNKPTFLSSGECITGYYYSWHFWSDFIGSYDENSYHTSVSWWLVPGTFYMDERCGPIDIVLAEREKYYNV